MSATLKFAVGQSMPRLEDEKLLRGRGRYADDVQPADSAFLFVLRSPYAHARLLTIDTDAAKSMPGVLAVLTADDASADGIGAIPCLIPMQSINGSPRADVPRPVLAAGHVKHVGDPVAVVVATTLAQAKDAAEAIACDYDALPAVTDAFVAAQTDAPLVWPEVAGNQCFDWQQGNEAAVNDAFKRAEHVTRATILNNRLVVAPIEPRSAVAEYDPASDRSTLHTPSQGAHVLLDQLADVVLKIPKDKLRIVTGQVGGSFGMKLFLYPEQCLVLWASRRLKRAVRWTADRNEAFLSDIHGRDNHSQVELALRKDGELLGMRVRTFANLGAYLSNYGPYIPTFGTVMLAGQYKTPAIHVRVHAMFTNTVPVDAYRGAGRPEAIYLIERSLDIAARELGLSPVQIRRRNFVPAAAMPFTAAFGDVYDSGEFEAVMDTALIRADYAGFELRRQQSLARGKLRGIGLSCYIERCGGGAPETAIIRVLPEGRVRVVSSAQDNGQGHLTTKVQVVAQRLGLDPDLIDVIQGDSDEVPMGFTGGSRFGPVNLVAARRAADNVIELGKEAAGEELEVSAADLEYSDGRYRVAGTDLTVSIFDVARRLSNRPEPLGLVVSEVRTPDAPTFPNGCHIAEVEIDRATGEVELLRYTVVDDFGEVINPMIIAGQVHGGIVQGIGQALYEHTAYDPESGQLLSASFMDYALPRADQISAIDFSLRNVRCVTNPMGLKGAGEAGAVGSVPAMVNAVIDALHPVTGTTHLDMPLTPERIWGVLKVNEAQ